MSWSRVAVAVWCVASAACDGGEVVVAPDEAPIEARVRLLTDAQYANAVRDLLGDVAVPELRTPGTAPHQFIHEDVIAVDAALLVQYRIAAETVAAEVAARRLAIDVEDFATRAFRRPLDDDERAGLAGLEAQGGAALVVEAVLQSPDFLYRSELGSELTPYELATELSFLFLDSIPDEPLWAAARDGSLARQDVLAAQVERLLAMPRVRAHLEMVVLDWLEVWKVREVGKDPVLFPELDEDLRRSMLGETERFVHDVLWQRRGSLRELLRSRRSFVDARLAAHYGAAPPDRGLDEDGFGPIRHDAETRSGVLTQASLLTSLGTARGESIIRRGIYVHRHFLCTPELGRPPFDAIASVAPLTGRLTEQQFSHYRNAHLYCRGCHRVIDPPGRALHDYDGLGRWRRTDELLQPIEHTVELVMGDQETWVTGAVELSETLAESDRVAACVVDQLAHHAFGVGFTEASGAATRRALHERFEASDRDLVDVFRAIATSPAFRKRSPQASAASRSVEIGSGTFPTRPIVEARRSRGPGAP